MPEMSTEVSYLNAIELRMLSKIRNQANGQDFGIRFLTALIHRTPSYTLLVDYSHSSLSS